MKVSIKKDGYVYVNNKRFTEEDLRKLLEILAKAATKEKLLQVLKTVTNLVFSLGAQTRPLSAEMKDYLSGFTSAEQWKDVIEKEIRSVVQWHKQLPVDEKEIQFQW